MPRITKAGNSPVGTTLGITGTDGPVARSNNAAVTVAEVSAMEIRSRPSRAVKSLAATIRIEPSSDPRYTSYSAEVHARVEANTRLGLPSLSPGSNYHNITSRSRITKSRSRRIS